MGLLIRADDEWYTEASKNKLFIRRIEDYHEIVGGDFYEYIDLEGYAVLEWQNPTGPALAMFETLKEAEDKLRDFFSPTNLAHPR
ncbi:MAG: hypothetical protein V2B19_12950 [Pseudomonadota bacterium]